MLESIWKDLRLAARLLWKKPGFTLVVVLTLALGIGANTAIFSVVNAVLLRPLPFPNPEQIVLVRDDLTGRQLENIGMSVDELRDLQERSGVFEDISAVWPVDANLTGSDRPERIELLAVSPNYFSLLGVGAQLGRVLGPQDMALGFAESVVISDGLWRRLFNSDPAIMGRKIRADGDLYTIVGVAPPGFRHPGQTLRNDVDVWATAGFAANPFGPPVRGARILPGAIGRLKAGMNLAQAQSKMDAFVAALKQQFPNDYPADAKWGGRLETAQEELIEGVRPTLWVLFGAVGLVLLIACVNIANLLLVRASGRQREMAIRLALGAGRGRLITQLLMESLLLAALGGGLALLIVAWVMKGLLRLAPADLPRMQEIGIDGGVLGFAGLLSLLTGVLFGMIPALQASRPDITPNLKEGGQGAGTSATQSRIRSALVILEFGLSLILMIGAGLLLRSFSRLMDTHPGFNPQNVLTARIWLPIPNNPELDPYRPPAKRAAFIKEVLRRTSVLPGVRSVAIGNGNGVPLLPPHNTNTYTIEDQADSEGNPPRALSAAVSPEYFQTIGAPLKQGRFLEMSDDENNSARAAVIDESMAQRFFQGLDPIGRRIKFGRRGSTAPWMTIVGIVGNIKTEGLDQPDQPHLYSSVFQNPGYSMALYIRAEHDPVSLTGALRREIQAVDVNLPLFGERRMSELLENSLAQRRFLMQLVALFGLLALLLAGVGVYGVMSYQVSQRTREIGVRLALGASSAAILKWALGQGMRLALVGVVLGLGGALALTRVLRSLLFGVSATDVMTYLALTALLVGVALFACLIPARRATKVDPMVALRGE